MKLYVVLGAVCLALCAAGCDAAPSSTDSATATDAPVIETVDVASHSGQSYDAFVRAQGMERFALDKLDLTAEERARLTRDMTAAQPSRLISGGGAQALVFTGCQQEGCAAGTAVIAIGNHGETFVGVRDATGQTEFIQDDRLEALLRLNSPTRRWDDPGVSAPTAEGVTP